MYKSVEVGDKVLCNRINDKRIEHGKWYVVTWAGIVPVRFTSTLLQPFKIKNEPYSDHIWYLNDDFTLMSNFESVVEKMFSETSIEEK